MPVNILTNTINGEIISDVIASSSVLDRGDYNFAKSLESISFNQDYSLSSEAD